MCCLFCLFISVCPFGSCKSTCLLSFFYLFGSSRFGYLSVDLPIDLPIVLFISLLTYLRTWFANMYIYIYIKKTYIYIYIHNIYFVSLSSSYQQSIFPLSNYLQLTYFCIQHLFTTISTCLCILLIILCLCMRLSCACVYVVFPRTKVLVSIYIWSKDKSPGKYTHDPNT